jgi:hypothetical protein
LIRLWTNGIIFGSADLSKLSLEECDLSSTDFSRCEGMSDETLRNSFGVKHGNGETLLPANLEAPDHWLTTCQGFAGNYSRYHEWLASRAPSGNQPPDAA